MRILDSVLLLISKLQQGKNAFGQNTLFQIRSARGQVNKRNEMKLKETRQRHGKSKQRKVVRVELRAAEGLHRPEKSEKSAGDMEKPW